MSKKQGKRYCKNGTARKRGLNMLGGLVRLRNAPPTTTAKADRVPAFLAEEFARPGWGR